MKYFLAFIVVALCSPALAQTIATSTPAESADLVATDSIWHGLWTYLQPAATIFLTTAASAIAAALVGLFVQLLRKAGIETTEADRKRYHDAAENALKNAIAKYTGTMPNMITGIVPPEVLQKATEYFKKLNPDTAKKLGDSAVLDIILSKVPDIAVLIAAAKSTSSTAIEVGKVAGPGKS